jgi:hypothetical protein
MSVEILFERLDDGGQLPVFQPRPDQKD